MNRSSRIRVPAAPLGNVAHVRLLETLEDRAQPSATMVDLSTAGSEGAINGALFMTTDIQPTGCGVIDDFLRVQSSGEQEGFNTDAKRTEYDEKGGAFTHSLRLNEVPIVTINGVRYREFLLGINQDQDRPLLSLDNLQIFLGDRGDLTGHDPVFGTLAGKQAIYNMDAGGDSWVKMNSALSNGNGSGDVFIYIPDALFKTTSAEPNPYVYLYSKFGEHYAANGGFEQWAVRELPPPPVAETGTLAGYVYVDVLNPDGTRPPVEGLTVNLLNETGNVVGSATTNANGSFLFTTLPPGTYTLQVGSTGEVLQQAGSINGTTVGDDLSVSGQISNITLGEGDDGIDYIFLLPPQG